MRLLLLPATLLVLLCGCRHDKGTIIRSAISCSTPATVSFSNDLKPFFSKNCALAGCHSGSSPQGNLNLEPAVAYSQLMNPSAGYVDTIHPNYSLVYAQMNSVSDPMPPTGLLDQCSRELVLKWIEQKAKNN